MATQLELEHMEFESFPQRRFSLSTFFSNWTSNFQLLSWDGSMLPTQTLLHAIYRYYQI